MTKKSNLYYIVFDKFIEIKKSYDKKGRLNEIGSYRGNVKHGQFKTLDSTGNIISNKLYLNDQLISEGNYREAKQYKIQGNLRLDLEKMLENEYFKKIKEKYPDLDFLYTFYNQYF